jgi:hypothetical protein
MKIVTQKMLVGQGLDTLSLIPASRPEHAKNSLSGALGCRQFFLV